MQCVDNDYYFFITGSLLASEHTIFFYSKRKVVNHPIDSPFIITHIRNRVVETERNHSIMHENASRFRPIFVTRLNYINSHFKRTIIRKDGIANNRVYNGNATKKYIPKLYNNVYQRNRKLQNYEFRESNSKFEYVLTHKDASLNNIFSNSVQNKKTVLSNSTTKAHSTLSRVTDEALTGTNSNASTSQFEFILLPLPPPKPIVVVSYEPCANTSIEVNSFTYMKDMTLIKNVSSTYFDTQSNLVTASDGESKMEKKKSEFTNIISVSVATKVNINTNINHVSEYATLVYFTNYMNSSTSASVTKQNIQLYSSTLEPKLETNINIHNAEYEMSLITDFTISMIKSVFPTMFQSSKQRYSSTLTKYISVNQSDSSITDFSSSVTKNSEIQSLNTEKHVTAHKLKNSTIILRHSSLYYKTDSTFTYVNTDRKDDISSQIVTLSCYTSPEFHASSTTLSHNIISFTSGSSHTTSIIPLRSKASLRNETTPFATLFHSISLTSISSILTLTPINTHTTTTYSHPPTSSYFLTEKSVNSRSGYLTSVNSQNQKSEIQSILPTTYKIIKITPFASNYYRTPGLATTLSPSRVSSQCTEVINPFVSVLHNMTYISKTELYNGTFSTTLMLLCDLQTLVTSSNYMGSSVRFELSSLSDVSKSENANSVIKYAITTIIKYVNSTSLGTKEYTSMSSSNHRISDIGNTRFKYDKPTTTLSTFQSASGALLYETSSTSIFFTTTNSVINKSLVSNNIFTNISSEIGLHTSSSVATTYIAATSVHLGVCENSTSISKFALTKVAGKVPFGRTTLIYSFTSKSKSQLAYQSSSFTRKQNSSMIHKTHFSLLPSTTVSSATTFSFLNSFTLHINTNATGSTTSTYSVLSSHCIVRSKSISNHKLHTLQPSYDSHAQDSFSETKHKDSEIRGSSLYIKSISSSVRFLTQSMQNSDNSRVTTSARHTVSPLSNTSPIVKSNSPENLSEITEYINTITSIESTSTTQSQITSLGIITESYTLFITSSSKEPSYDTTSVTNNYNAISRSNSDTHSMTAHHKSLSSFNATSTKYDPTTGTTIVGVTYFYTFNTSSNTSLTKSDRTTQFIENTSSLFIYKTQSETVISNNFSFTKMMTQSIASPSISTVVKIFSSIGVSESCITTAMDFSSPLTISTVSSAKSVASSIYITNLCAQPIHITSAAATSSPTAWSHDTMLYLSINSATSSLVTRSDMETSNVSSKVTSRPLISMATVSACFAMASFDITENEHPNPISEVEVTEYLGNTLSPNSSKSEMLNWTATHMLSSNAITHSGVNTKVHYKSDSKLSVTSWYTNFQKQNSPISEIKVSIKSYSCATESMDTTSSMKATATTDRRTISPFAHASPVSESSSPKKSLQDTQHTINTSATDISMHSISIRPTKLMNMTQGSKNETVVLLFTESFISITCGTFLLTKLFSVSSSHNDVSCSADWSSLNNSQRKSVSSSTSDSSMTLPSNTSPTDFITLSISKYFETEEYISSGTISLSRSQRKTTSSSMNYTKFSSIRSNEESVITETSKSLYFSGLNTLTSTRSTLLPRSLSYKDLSSLINLTSSAHTFPCAQLSSLLYLTIEPSDVTPFNDYTSTGITKATSLLHSNSLVTKLCSLTSSSCHRTPSKSALNCAILDTLSTTLFTSCNTNPILFDGSKSVSSKFIEKTIHTTTPSTAPSSMRNGRFSSNLIENTFTSTLIQVSSIPTKSKSNACVSSTHITIHDDYTPLSEVVITKYLEKVQSGITAQNFSSRIISDDHSSIMELTISTNIDFSHISPNSKSYIINNQSHKTKFVSTYVSDIITGTGSTTDRRSATTPTPSNVVNDYTASFIPPFHTIELFANSSSTTRSSSSTLRSYINPSTYVVNNNQSQTNERPKEPSSPATMIINVTGHKGLNSYQYDTPFKYQTFSTTLKSYTESFRTATSNAIDSCTKVSKTQYTLIESSTQVKALSAFSTCVADLAAPDTPDWTSSHVTRRIPIETFPSLLIPSSNDILYAKTSEVNNNSFPNTTQTNTFITFTNFSSSQISNSPHKVESSQLIAPTSGAKAHASKIHTCLHCRLHL